LGIKYQQHIKYIGNTRT
jgi:hypothetical protein